jgi:myo-inositol-1(or 4)-monophosphatase
MNRLRTAIEAARAGGAALRDGRIRDLEIREKEASRTSIVTCVDLHSQHEIFRVIGAAHPDDAIVGEEGRAGDWNGSSVWYVDPLDGTTNYSHGFPCYCVSIAHCDALGPTLGIIYDPHHEDLFVAIRDGGATRNEQPIAVSGVKGLRSSLLSTQVQSDDPILLDRYAARSRRFAGVARAVRSIGSPALALAYVACGWLDAFCEPRMSPWDTLAGGLLVNEAGGQVTTFDGGPRPHALNSDILASNGLLHDDLLRLLVTEVTADAQP